MAHAFSYGDLGGFPPGRSFLLIPRRPREAAANALALYEAVEPRQRAVLATARTMLKVAPATWLRSARATRAGVDVDWWAAWFAEQAAPFVPAPAMVAYRVPPNGRTSALLLDAAGKPLAFAKILSAPADPLHAQIAAALQDAPLPFASPRVLAVGEFRGTPYRLYDPLPAGAHRRPPASPVRVSAIISAWQTTLATIPRPVSARADDVVVHGDFTPRNLRVVRDGSWWLIDWDNARWGPRLADELHYWCADRSWRLSTDADRDARWILQQLRRSGSDDDIARAAGWPDAPPRTYRPREQDLRAAVGRLVAEGRA